MLKNVGIDIGSTTVKVVVMQGEQILYRIYRRHMSQVRQATLQALAGAREFLQGNRFTRRFPVLPDWVWQRMPALILCREVFATHKAVMEYEPDTPMQSSSWAARMPKSSSSPGLGGTNEREAVPELSAAFIDQMATLLNISTEEMDRLSLQHERIYPIASRCGVFAKTDIQPLLNQGVRAGGRCPPASFRRW